jgi:hypothetical protein
MDVGRTYCPILDFELNRLLSSCSIGIRDLRFLCARERSATKPLALHLHREIDASYKAARLYI